MSTATMEIPIDQKVLAFIGAPRKMLIGGRWIEAASGKTFPTYNPATGEVLAQVAEGTQQRVLHEILGIPDVPGQPPAVAVQIRPQRVQRQQELIPGAGQAAPQSFAELDIVHLCSPLKSLLHRRMRGLRGYVAGYLYPPCLRSASDLTRS